MNNLYQGDGWTMARETNGQLTIKIEVNEKNNKGEIIAFEQEIKTPFGKRKILMAEGNPEFDNERILSLLLEKFKEESKKYLYGLIQPRVLDYNRIDFDKAGFKKVVNHTILIDLKKSEEELFKNLEKKSARWGVNFAKKNNLSCEEAVSDEEIEEFYELYKKTTKEGKFNSKSIEFIKNIINGKVGKLFLVKINGQVLAGGLILIDEIYNILSLTTSSDEGHRFQAMPFLYWNLILLSKKMGKKYFDLGGYDSEAKIGEKLYNVNKFKENFGGEIVEQPIFATNWIYPFVRSLMKRFKVLKRLYKKT